MFSEASQTEWRQPFDFPSISPVNGEYPNHVISGISLLHDKGLKQMSSKDKWCFSNALLYLLYLLFLTDSYCFRRGPPERSFVVLLQLNYI